MTKRGCLLVVLVCLVGGAAVWADSAAGGEGAWPAPAKVSGPLTLAKAVETALANSPSLAAARQRARGASFSMLEAVGEKVPSLSATLAATTGTMSSTLTSPMEVTPSTVFNMGREGSLMAQLMLMYPLSTGGRLERSIDAAALSALAADQDVETASLDVALETKLAYRQALRTAAYVEVYQEYVADSEERLRADQAKYDVGKLPLQYLLRDKAELANAKQMLANARRDAAMALSDLKTAMAVSLDSEVQLTDELSHQPIVTTLESLLAAAEANRPEIAAAKVRVEAAKASTRAAVSAYRPQVNAVLMAGGMSTDGMREAGYAAGIVVGIPLVDVPRLARRDTAAAGEAEMGEQLRQVHLQVANEVNKAWLALTAAEASVAAAQEVVASAEEDYRVAKLRYEAGKSVNVEVIDAQAALLRARANYTDALYEFNAALDQLERAVGGKIPEQA